MNLPSDIVDEILSLLPAKSLLRFKVVCKDWYTHISKSFIAKHTKNNEKLLIYHNKFLRTDSTLSICREEEKQDDDNDVDDGDIDYDADIRTLFNQSKKQYFIKHMGLKPLKNRSSTVRVDIIGTCNGIVCLDFTESFGVFFDRFITLWNPTTREINTLPPIQQQSPPGTQIWSDHVGFGFDGTTDDYKVNLCLRKEGLQEEYISVLKIYSLSSNSWGEFHCSGLSPVIFNVGRNSRMVFGNKFCWLAKDFESNETFIFSFDMSKEICQKTPLPSEYEKLVKKGYYAELFGMHDSVALVLYARTHSGTTIEMWTTDDLEQSHSSWIKFCTVDPIAGDMRGLGFWKCRNSNNLFFLFTDEKVMKGIDMKNGSPVKINVKNNSIPRRVFTYLEMLVSVNSISKFV